MRFSMTGMPMGTTPNFEAWRPEIGNPPVSDHAFVFSQI
jgi:hypothetical protein